MEIATDLTNTRFAQISYIAAPIYMLCNGFTKLSLLTFYLHISPEKLFRIAVWISIGIVSLYTLGITLAMLLVCNPPRKAFDFKVGGQCIDAAVLYIATAVSNIATDVILFILPIPMIYNLQIPRKQKAVVVVVFGIASMTIFSSIIRLAYLPVVLASTDPSWDAAPANIWTFIEGNLFVICGSITTLQKFLRHFAPQLVGYSSGTHGASSYNRQQNHGRRPSRVRNPRSGSAQSHEEPAVELQHFPQRSLYGDGDTVRDCGIGNGQDDGDSQKSILRTRTFTVEYSFAGSGDAMERTGHL
ncbi:uncharacterized protein FFNC_15717 [Fusarium fujikuroi]|nr:uncharacterized protein FFNC_15717 [Fusarium fujikuroi]